MKFALGGDHWACGSAAERLPAGGRQDGVGLWLAVRGFGMERKGGRRGGGGGME
jgi:hypothetical protein